MAHNPDVDHVLVDDGQADSSSNLAETLRREALDVAILAHPGAGAAGVGRVSRRYSPTYWAGQQIFIAALLTDRIWQHRSQGQKHEADYNLELLAPLAVPFLRVSRRNFILTEAEKAQARAALSGHRIRFLKNPS